MRKINVYVFDQGKAERLNKYFFSEKKAAEYAERWSCNFLFAELAIMTANGWRYFRNGKEVR